MSTLKNIKERLGVGAHNITDIKFLKDGESQHGKWFLYSGVSDTKEFTIFGKEKDKDLLDSGSCVIELFHFNGKLCQSVKPAGDIKAQPQNLPPISNANSRLEENDSVPLPTPPPEQMPPLVGTFQSKDQQIMRSMFCKMAANSFESLHHNESLENRADEILDLARELEKHLKDWLLGNE